jgi:hypothetical protein
MIEPRWGHRMVAHEGRLYVVGGRGESARVTRRARTGRQGLIYRARVTIFPWLLQVVEYGQSAAGTRGALRASTFTIPPATFGNLDQTTHRNQRNS